MRQLKQFIFTLIFLIALSIVNNAFAGGGPPGWPPPCVPIDGGISFLLFAGAIYGGKKVYDISKKTDI